MRIIRIMAQLIDLFVCFAALMISYLTVPPVLSLFTSSPNVNGAVVFVITVLLAAGAQYPFFKVNQTVGKAFFGLEIESTDPQRPMDLSVMLQRELFLKLMTCYFICFPVLYGSTGGHEVATATRVVRNTKHNKKKEKK